MALWSTSAFLLEMYITANGIAWSRYIAWRNIHVIYNNIVYSSNK